MPGGPGRRWPGRPGLRSSVGIRGEWGLLPSKAAEPLGLRCGLFPVAVAIGVSPPETRRLLRPLTHFRKWVFAFRVLLALDPHGHQALQALSPVLRAPPRFLRMPFHRKQL